MQKLDLVEGRWGALMAGEKLDTVRWNEGTFEPGFLVYELFPSRRHKTVVYVTAVRKLRLEDVLLHTADVIRKPDADTLLMRMQVHYPDITLDTPVDYIQHLSPTETASKYPTEVTSILSMLD